MNTKQEQRDEKSVRISALASLGRAYIAHIQADTREEYQHLKRAFELNPALCTGAHKETFERLRDIYKPNPKQIAGNYDGKYK